MKGLDREKLGDEKGLIKKLPKGKGTRGGEKNREKEGKRMKEGKTTVFAQPILVRVS